MDLSQHLRFRARHLNIELSMTAAALLGTMVDSALAASMLPLPYALAQLMLGVLCCVLLTRHGCDVLARAAWLRLLVPAHEGDR